MWWWLVPAALASIAIGFWVFRRRERNQRALRWLEIQQTRKEKIKALVPGATFVALSPSLNFLLGTVVEPIDNDHIQARVHKTDITASKKLGPSELGPFPIRYINRINGVSYETEI